MPKKPKAVTGVYERDPGSDLWCARLRVRGKLVRKSFGRGPAGRSAAIDWVEKARTVRRTGEGILPPTAKRPVLTTKEVAILGDTGGVTAGKLCDGFLAYIKHHPEEYRDQKNPPVRIAKIKDVFGDRIASGLKSSEIETWLDELKEDRKLANATINKLRGSFSMIFQHGKRKDLVDINPAADVPLRDVGNGVERYLSEAEEKRLREVLQKAIDACDPIRQPILRNHAVQRRIEFDFALKTGVRKSEQFNLTWADADLKRRIMRLRVTKNGKPRNAFIIDDVAADLKQLQEMTLGRRDGRQDADLVFSKTDNHKWFNAYLKEAKIKNFRWHDLRHTFCSRLVQAGVHLSVVREAAGHASFASTLRYSHLAPSQIHDALAVLNSTKQV
ncbi:site-specific integrase [Edaphobacter sp. HDX4]|uniref:tyrosine-type recombinase/integrase n=1 Tax=Edaphobacter sp. HDX4 TaxID=2794064 RepID=UPI002FE570E2